MTEDVKKYVQQLLNRIDGLYCILITDRDGVPVLKVAADNAPELGMRTSFLSTFGMATDQGGKLGLGKNKALVCIYSTYQVVQINKLPLVLSFIGSVNCNTGQILLMEEQIEPLLSDLKVAVADS
ncbi:hypothetical protein L9F63_025856 [Diploptera punctata]|uniref:Uncharacterized protein n=1 Tax=Diploptera punctata TaxID=6984 RepID=A0AAD7Z760_DIPPU|nr:hypothetical protein L9F63_025856 [Diploptera punctata]